MLSFTKVATKENVIALKSQIVFFLNQKLLLATNEERRSAKLTSMRKYFKKFKSTSNMLAFLLFYVLVVIRDKDKSRRNKNFSPMPRV